MPCTKRHKLATAPPQSHTWHVRLILREAAAWRHESHDPLFRLSRVLWHKVRLIAGVPLGWRKHMAVASAVLLRQQTLLFLARLHSSTWQVLNWCHQAGGLEPWTILPSGRPMVKPTAVAAGLGKTFGQTFGSFWGHLAINSIN